MPRSGWDEWAARPVARSLTRKTPRVASPSRLPVGSPLTRKAGPGEIALAAAAPSLPRSSPTTNSRPTRSSPLSRSRSAAVTWAARAPFASQAPRP